MDVFAKAVGRMHAQPVKIIAAQKTVMQNAGDAACGALAGDAECIGKLIQLVDLFAFNFVYGRGERNQQPKEGPKEGQKHHPDAEKHNRNDHPRDITTCREAKHGDGEGKYQGIHRRQNDEKRNPEFQFLHNGTSLAIHALYLYHKRADMSRGKDERGENFASKKRGKPLSHNTDLGVRCATVKCDVVRVGHAEIEI